MLLYWKLSPNTIMAMAQLTLPTVFPGCANVRHSCRITGCKLRPCQTSIHFVDWLKCILALSIKLNCIKSLYRMLAQILSSVFYSLIFSGPNHNFAYFRLFYIWTVLVRLIVLNDKADLVCFVQCCTCSLNANKITCMNVRGPKQLSCVTFTLSDALSHTLLYHAM